MTANRTDNLATSTEDLLKSLVALHRRRERTKFSAVLRPWQDMRRNALNDTANWQTKHRSTVKEFRTVSHDYHFKKEELDTERELSRGLKLVGMRCYCQPADHVLEC